MAWTDDRVDQIIGKLLRAGVSLSVAIVLSGAVLYLRHYGFERPAYHLFRSEPAALRKVSGIASGAFHARSEYLIQLGLLVLIATPVARVAFSVVAFALERDWTYVAITVIVLAVLLLSLTGRI